MNPIEPESEQADNWTMKNAYHMAKRIADSRNAKKAGWALEFEAEYFEECRASLLTSIAEAGKNMLDAGFKARLREVYRVVKAGTFTEALVGCYEAAILITWEGRARGWGRTEICIFSSYNTMTDDAREGHDTFDLGYMTVTKAYY